MKNVNEMTNEELLEAHTNITWDAAVDNTRSLYTEDDAADVEAVILCRMSRTGDNDHASRCACPNRNSEN